MVGFPRLRLLLPPSEPDVRVAAHPALHKHIGSGRCQGILQSTHERRVVIPGAGETADRPEFLRVHPREEDAGAAICGIARP